MVDPVAVVKQIWLLSMTSQDHNSFSINHLSVKVEYGEHVTVGCYNSHNFKDWLWVSFFSLS